MALLSHSMMLCFCLLWKLSLMKVVNRLSPYSYVNTSQTAYYFIVMLLIIRI